MGTKQVYQFECNDKQQTDSKLNTFDCAILNDLELYNVHTMSPEIDSGLFPVQKWIMLSALEK